MTIHDTPKAVLAAARSTFLLMSNFERLEEWCRLVDVVFDHHTTYLVGSTHRTAAYRDVDLRCILPDVVFDRWWRDPVKVRYVNRAVSIWGQQETGLPIDFQVQRMTEANEQFGGQPRNPMGFRNWATIPTSGVPPMTTHGTPESALAAAERYVCAKYRWTIVGEPGGPLRSYNEFAVALLAALDGWTLVRASQIDKYLAEIARLRVALKRLADDFVDEIPEQPDDHEIEWLTDLGALRQARAALASREASE